MSGLGSLNPMGIFGGTFDPIHYGHLRSALELLEALEFSEVRFMPAGNPPHRIATHADGRTRVALVQAAIDGEPRFILDDRELRREGPSYSVDTLLDLRAEFAHRSLCLVVGMDAYLSLPQWHQWREILELAHLVVAHRPGWQAPQSGTLGELLADRGTARVQDLHESRAGRVYVRAVTQLEISSSAIRELVRAGRDPRYLVPDPVRRLLAESGCYHAAAERN
ncbi:MAG TPA: nicotinate-nucleotide adenylyltransferase [Gammaproteobacteria bacterium]|nr:nicotinate-nucleotide adenylyltransferase [Gammaproteobacteria bacterium]